THANLWSALDVRPPVGTCYWPVEVRFIEGKATVTSFTDSSYISTSGLEIGDIITAVDGVSINALIEKWSPFYCASNQTTRMRDVARYLPRGECGVSNLTIERQGRSQIVLLPRTQSSGRQTVPHDRPGETFQLLSPDIAYIKLSSIRNSDVPEYIEMASGTSGLIIDIRNYPSEFVVFTLGRRLVEQPTPFARFTRGVLDNPGAFSWTDPLKLFPVTPGYKGKIAILVDEVSISQAEYTAMAFRAAPGAVVIGSTTAGADGNVSGIPLPGGLQTMISGIGVFYPDKSPTQRVGIIPDIVVKPTREGIRTGRDEILEAALSHILGIEVNEEIMEMARRN
ncbi:MAG: S41 family peptidase, partial [Anaerolineales bacterium]